MRLTVIFGEGFEVECDCVLGKERGEGVEGVPGLENEEYLELDEAILEGIEEVESAGEVVQGSDTVHLLDHLLRAG